MKYKSTRTGEIVEIPDTVKVNPQAYTPVDGGNTQQTDNPNAGMKSLYQNMFNQAKTIKDRSAIATSYKTSTGEELFASGIKPKSEDELKKERAKAELANTLDLLEEKYFTNKIAQGRIGGLLSNLLQKAGYNANLTDYSSLRESIKPTLVRAAGDVGALNLPEQEAAIKSIPTEFSTLEEATKQFETTRRKFGIPLKEKKKKASLEEIFQ